MVLVIHRRRTIATIVDRKLTWNTILSSSGALAKAIRSSNFDSSGGGKLEGGGCCAPNRDGKVATPCGKVSSHVWGPTTTSFNFTPPLVWNWMNLIQFSEE